MPYTVIAGAEGCSGYAVVLEGSTTPIEGGCHALKSEAIAHMVALEAAYEDELEEEDDEEERQEPNLVAPAFMRQSARRGLRLHEEGHSGDGLKPQTVADARKMAESTALSEDKWRRIAPWIARHTGDLDAVQGDEITPGLVAMLLWGGGSTKQSARRAQDYAERLVARLDEKRYDPNQPRDGKGQFASKGGGAGGGDEGDGGGSGAGSPDGDDIFDEMDAPSEAEEALLNNQQDYVDGLSEKKVETINEYTAGAHEDMNKLLRGGPPPPPNLDDEEAERIERANERLITTLERAPQIPADVTVYRGADLKSLGLSGDEPLDALVGAELFDDGIVSTSFDPLQAGTFATGDEVLLKINVPKGVKGLAVEEISNFPQEREFLMPPGGFKVIGVEGGSSRTRTLVVERIPKTSER